MTEVHTLTLAGFVLARIGDDEAVAHAARVAPSPWTVTGLGYSPCVADADDDAICYAEDSGNGEMHRDVAAHVARHDPAHVLADCEAKRRIVERCSHDFWMFGSPTPTRQPNTFEAQWILAALALPYADHEDFREEWRV
jgi:hypothetical protein